MTIPPDLGQTARVTTHEDASMTDTPTPPRTGSLHRLFVAHPAAVNESYFRHMGVALRFSGLLSLAAGAALVHALVPALCERTASRTIERLHGEMARRH